MNNILNNIWLKNIRAAALATSFLAAAFLAGNANAGPTANSIKLLTANFVSRQVVKIEAGDFHFLPGQVAPIHTHSAPAVGYVTKGAIIYQVEGEKPQILRAGDVFFEPVGPRILRFDNLSATEEAIFIDFNLEQAGEPFIVFEKPLTEVIDRRTLPTTELKATKVNQVNFYENVVQPNGVHKIDVTEPTLGIVAEGVIELRVNGKTQRIVAGASFVLPEAGTKATIVNVSSEIAAKVITFHLL